MTYRPDRLALGFLRRTLHGAVAVWYHPRFRLPIAGLESQLRIEPQRADHVLTWAMDMGIVRTLDVHQAPPVAWGQLRLVHDEAYLASLDQAETLARILGVDSRILSVESMLLTWRHAVGAVVEAAQDAVRSGGREVVLLGGFHHAFPDRGGGFCGVNDVAIAVAALREQGFDERVVVLDLDAHPPDGTAACLRSDPAVHIASVSAESAWDEVRDVDEIRIPRGSDDRAYARAVGRLLDRLPSAGLVLYLAGADPLADDPHGGLACTVNGLRRRDRRVLEAIGNTPAVILPAGGYTHGAWRVLAGTVAEAAGARLGVSREYDPLLRRSLDISRTLDPTHLSGEEGWLTERDLLGALGMVSPEERFVGYYTLQGVEYALCRYGYLDTLRRMGFEGVRVWMQARRWPHMVRILARIDGEDQVLVEVALSRRRVDRWETLFVEWLTLRDPRTPFTDDRPRMPGQDAPGLGILDDTGHILLRMTERLGLDGVSFVPSYYHIAWFSRRRWTVVDPVQRGRFLALQHHLRDIPLREATTLLDGAGIPTEHGDPIRWEPPLMAYPRFAEFTQWLESQQQRADRVADVLTGELVPVR